MTVKMDWVGKSRGTDSLLNDPIGPLGSIGDLDQVVILGVVGVALSKVLESRLSWVDQHARSIDGPENDGVVVGRDGSVVEGDRQFLSFGLESILGHIFRNLWRVDGILARSRWVGQSTRGRVRQSRAIVGEDGTADRASFDEAYTRGVRLGAEPVVVGRLVGGEDNVIALTYRKY